MYSVTQCMILHLKHLALAPEPPYTVLQPCITLPSHIPLGFQRPASPAVIVAPLVGIASFLGRYSTGTSFVPRLTELPTRRLLFVRHAHPLQISFEMQMILRQPKAASSLCWAPSCTSGLSFPSLAVVAGPLFHQRTGLIKGCENDQDGDKFIG